MYRPSHYTCVPSSPSARSRSLYASLALFACLVAFASAADAATFTVTTTSDTGAGSLRAAVAAAAASAGADTINFAIPAASCDAVTGRCTITLASEIVMDATGGALTINGTGAHLLTIDAGPGTNRIFYSFSGATLTLTGMTLTGGNGVGGAGQFSDLGGAIYLRASTLVLDGVHVTGNSAPVGGGVYLFQGISHQIFNSTFSSNTSGNCGAFMMDSTEIVVGNTTVSGNTASSSGGGVCVNGFANVTLRNLTIASNTAGVRGGGIYHQAGATRMGSSIVAANTSPDGPDIRLDAGSIISAGYNLIGTNTTVEVRFPAGNPNAANDIVGTSAGPISPNLGPLADNGGTRRVPTRSLLNSSPAIDKGNSFGSFADQRGLARPVDLASSPNAAGGDGADIGAFEAQAPTAAAVSISGRIETPEGSGLTNAIVMLSHANGNVRPARSSSFGYFRFDDVTVGETYIVTVSSKRYTFTPIAIALTDAVTDMILVADSSNENKRKDLGISGKGSETQRKR